VSTRTEKPSGGGGLSVTTLVIASVSSIAAAYVIHTFWTGGVILGAGLTPVIVAIVSESLKRPTQAITSIREERKSRSTVAQRMPGETQIAPPPELERPDPFGIWEDGRQKSRFHWVKGRPLKIAVATGLLAFAIAAFVVTGADLVFGSGDGGDRLRIVPGTQQRSDRDREDTTTTTQPAETTETAPEEVPPAQTTPQTTTTPPQTTTTPPATTTPPPTTPVVPPEQQPAPQQPAPAPQG
jgi:hypothetical protein